MENFEKEYLEKVQGVLGEKLENVEGRISQLKSNIQELTDYFNENYSALMLHDADLAENNQEIEQYITALAERLIEQEKVLKQKNSPYFGRIDFAEKGEEGQPYYIGLAHVADNKDVLVCDWRAPLSSMYYDFGIGKAHYNVDEERFEGTLTKKRQYRIESGELKYMIESDQTISDDVLEYCLSQSNGTKMKEIAATIQSEQNNIIRREFEGNLIVQGCAGSGKTSVALHRAAYLLYKHRNLVRNRDILILSPSNAFTNYISNVLPSLGENNLIEMTFDELARNFLKVKVETKDEQMARISNMTEKELEILSYKGSFEFLEEFNRYISETLVNSFTPQDMAPFGIRAEELKEVFLTKGVDIKTRLSEVVTYICNKLKMPDHKKLEALKTRINEVIYRMLPSTDPEVIYKHFLVSVGILGESELETELSKNGYVLCEDLAPVVYIKKQLYGFEYDQPVKYLIIDEMQEYNLVHFKFLNEVFLCPKLLVGDINQCVDRVLDKEYLKKLARYFDAKLLDLEKSYRSTREIQFVADEVVGINVDKSFARKGEDVKFVKATDLLAKTKSLMKDYSKYNRVAVITKTAEEAEELYDNLKSDDVELLVGRGSIEGRKYLILPVALAKGLEFEAVIVYNSSSKMYKTSLDAKMLYIAATRAIHALAFLWEGTPSKFVHNA